MMSRDLFGATLDWKAVSERLSNEGLPGWKFAEVLGLSSGNNRGIDAKGPFKTLVREDFFEKLAIAGLSDPVMLFREQGLRTMRKVPSRQTVELLLQGKTCYLKKFLDSEGGITPQEQAFIEFFNLIELDRLGFLCPKPIVLAWGEVAERPFASIITLAIEGGVQADHLLCRIKVLSDSAKLTVPKDAFRRPSAQERKVILLEIGRVAARLHGCGLVHRDLYLCHFFPVLNQAKDVSSIRSRKRKTEVDLEVYLIDLARLFKPEKHFWRWRLKDLAALEYSSRQYGLTAAERQILWDGYFSQAGIPSVLIPLWKAAAMIKAFFIMLGDRERVKR